MLLLLGVGLSVFVRPHNFVNMSHQVISQLSASLFNFYVQFRIKKIPLQFVLIFPLLSNSVVNWAEESLGLASALENSPTNSVRRVPGGKTLILVVIRDSLGPWVFLFHKREREGERNKRGRESEVSPFWRLHFPKE